MDLGGRGLRVLRSAKWDVWGLKDRCSQLPLQQDDWHFVSYSLDLLLLVMMPLTNEDVERVPMFSQRPYAGSHTWRSFTGL